MAGQEAREALGVRRLEEADRPAALLGDPLDLRDREVDVPHRDDAERDEAAGVLGAPLVDDPVVVGLEHHQRQLLVARLGERARVEAGHGREAHRREHAVGVHVAHALVDVPATGAQLGERAGVEAPLLTRPTHGGGHAEGRRGALTLERPLVDALRVADDLRRLVEPLGGQVVLVHVGRLDHVVVDAHQDHVVHTHVRAPLGGRMTYEPKRRRTCARDSTDPGGRGYSCPPGPSAAAQRPPSIRMSMPLRKLASSETRKATTAATSSARPSRPRGVRSTICCMIGCSSAS